MAIHVKHVIKLMDVKHVMELKRDFIVFQLIYVIVKIYILMMDWFNNVKDVIYRVLHVKI